MSMAITQRERELSVGVPSRPRDDQDALPRAVRQLGFWSALSTFFIFVLYIPVLVVGFAAAGNMEDPLTDPYLAILEVLIVLIAPLMVLMMAAVHASASEQAKVFSLAALIHMVLVAGTTTGVHFVLLTVDRQLEPGDIAGRTFLFSWEWPSVAFALDILAWDWFLGLALLFAVPVFRGQGRLLATLRGALIVGGVLSIAGVVGPAVGDIRLRWIGQVGYEAVFPVVCLLIALVFRRTVPIGGTLRATD
jgi:hypothetical protein